MNPMLAKEVANHVSLGWQVRSQTDTTAALEDRSPFGWIWLALSLLLFLGLGGILYILFWLLTSKEHLFLRVEDGQLIATGDTWLVEQQIRDREEGKLLAAEVKRRGYIAVMWPSIIATLAMIVLWVFAFWLIVRLAT